MEKIYKKIGILIAITFIMFGYKEEVLASESEYEYPITPGTEEWSQYNHAEKVDMLNIDQNILDNMQTADLLEAVLEYPLFSDMYFYDGYQNGFEVMASHFNGLQELLKREDIANCLIEKYQEMQEPQNMDEQVRLADIEVILAQSNVQQLLSETDKEYLDNQKNLQKKRSTVSSNFFSNVYEKCIDEQKNIQSEKLERVQYHVSTPNGTSVPVSKNGEMLTAQDKYEFARQALAEYPSCTILSEATSKYNCHSYAWYLQSTVNEFWMPYAYYYWEDGSYRYNAAMSITNPTINTRMVYRSPRGTDDHSAIIAYSSGNRFVSKWGDGPLIRHSAYDNPYYYSGVSIRPYVR